MEMMQVSDGYELSDIGIAAGLLCAMRVDAQGKLLKDSNNKSISAFHYAGLKKRSKGEGFLFIIKGDTTLIRQRINAWFKGEAYDDLKAFSEQSQFLKAEIFDPVRLKEALRMGKQQKGKLENGHSSSE